MNHKFIFYKKINKLYVFTGNQKSDRNIMLFLCGTRLINISFLLELICDVYCTSVVNFCFLGKMKFFIPVSFYICLTNLKFKNIIIFNNIKNKNRYNIFKNKNKF